MSEMGKPDDLRELLTAAQKCGASDFCLKPGKAPLFTIHRQKVSAKLLPYTSSDIEALAMKVIADEDRKTLEKFGAAVFVHEIPGVGRFRISVYRRDVGVMLAARALNYDERA